MSLISGANFVAPLRSKVQVVGIFALAVLVAVLRLVGSAEPSDERGSAQARRTVAASEADPSVADEVDAFIAARRKSKALQGGAKTSGDITVDQLLQGGDDSGPSPSRGSARNAANDSAEPEKLNDIKRSLGLE